MSSGRPLANIADTAGNIALGSPSGHRAASPLPPWRTALFRGTPCRSSSRLRARKRAPS